MYLIILFLPHYIISKEVYKDTTDQHGTFIVKNFQPNLYDITVSSELFYFKKLYNILLIEGENKFVDIELKKKPVITELDKIIVRSQTLNRKKEV